MQTKKGDSVCFDTTTPDVVKKDEKDKGKKDKGKKDKKKDGKNKDKKKVEKGTTVRICVETKNNVKQWAKSVAKGKEDKVITGNTLDVSAENV